LGTAAVGGYTTGSIDSSYGSGGSGIPWAGSGTSTGNSGVVVIRYTI
jgi:hypothetical protein